MNNRIEEENDLLQSSLNVNLSQTSIYDHNYFVDEVDKDSDYLLDPTHDPIVSQEVEKENIPRQLNTPTRKNRSKVWDYFFIEPNGKKAVCQTCGAKLTFAGTTSNLAKHALTIHKISINKKRALSDNHSELSEAMILTPKKDELRMENFKSNEQRRDIKMERLLLNLLCDNYLSFHLIESFSFHDFVNYLNPAIKIPSRKAISGDILDRYYDLLLHKVIKLLDEADSICLTADVWTSMNQQQYLGLTAHFIDCSFEKINVFLACVFIQNETSDNLQTVVEDVLNNFQIKNKVHLMVTDNARNMELTASKLNFAWNRCLAHTINLVVQQLIQVYQVDKIIDKIKSIVTRIHSSPKCTNILNEYQKKLSMPVIKLKTSVPTRWNSTYEMLKVFTKLRDPLLLSASKLQIKMPDDNEQEMVNFLLKILGFFEELTRSFSIEKHVATSSVVYLISTLQSDLSDLKKTTKDVDKLILIQSTFDLLEKYRLRSLASNKIYAISAYLDPRFKKYAFSDGDYNNTNYDTAKRWTLEEASRLRGTVISSCGNNNNNLDILLSMYGQYAALERRKLTAFNANLRSENEIENEIHNYSRERPQSISCDPLIYWKDRSLQYPCLSKVAKKYLGFVASSVPCEHIFSKMGSIVNEQRTRLSPKRVNKICFLKCNRNLFENDK